MSQNVVPGNRVRVQAPDGEHLCRVVMTRIDARTERVDVIAVRFPDTGEVSIIPWGDK